MLPLQNSRSKASLPSRSGAVPKPDNEGMKGILLSKVRRVAMSGAFKLNKFRLLRII